MGKSLDSIQGFWRTVVMPSNLDSKFNRFIRGVSTPARVLSFCVDHPKLMIYSLLPMGMTILAVGIIIYVLLAGAWKLSNDFFMNSMGQYAQDLSQLMVVIVGLLSLYLLFHTFSLLLSLIASPFNDLLSEVTETSIGEKPKPLQFTDLVQVFFLDLRKTVLTLFIVGILGALTFVPGLGFFTFIGFALVQTLTFITYPQSRHGLGIVPSLVWIRAHFFESLGFGLVTLFLFGIPVLNLFALPVAVIGGTLLYFRK